MTAAAVAVEATPQHKAKQKTKSTCKEPQPVPSFAPFYLVCAGIRTSPPLFSRYIMHARFWFARSAHRCHFLLSHSVFNPIALTQSFDLKPSLFRLALDCCGCWSVLFLSAGATENSLSLTHSFILSHIHTQSSSSSRLFLLVRTSLTYYFRPHTHTHTHPNPTHPPPRLLPQKWSLSSQTPQHHTSIYPLCLSLSLTPAPLPAAASPAGPPRSATRPGS